MQVCMSMFIGAVQLETNIFVGTFVVCQWLFSVHHFSLKLNSIHSIHSFVYTAEASCVYKIRWRHICVSLRWLEMLLQAAAGSVGRHLPSLHVDPGICRLVRWLSHVWLSSSIPESYHLTRRTSLGTANVSVITGAFRP